MRNQYPCCSRCIKYSHHPLSSITATEIKNIDATEIKDRNDVDRIARLLSVDSNKLYKGLTSKTIYTREDAVTSSLSRDASLDVRDAFVKVKRL